ncbi:AzlD domain-containing protein, partial [Staphylococcus aureus]|uniref:AzlD domain-containing protein n=1 Tax=Staphylococcus aureus TaxID=1280 RepID=UPI00338E7EC2
MTWVVVLAGLAVGTFALRLSGVLLGARLRLSAPAERIMALAATVMLFALVVSTTLSAGESGAAG